MAVSFGENGKIKARMFFELVGFERENLNGNLKGMIDNLRGKIGIYKEEYAEPEKMDDKTYATHVEIEAEMPSIKRLFEVILMFEPSIIEIIEPGEFVVSAGEMQDILADVNSKMSQMNQNMEVMAARLRRANELLKSGEKELKSVKEDENKENNEIPKITI